MQYSSLLISCSDPVALQGCRVFFFPPQVIVAAGPRSAYSVLQGDFLGAGKGKSAFKFNQAI